MGITYTNNNKVKLNIGCGSNYLKDWINIDTESNTGNQKLDLMWDLKKPLPFRENSVDIIFDNHFLKDLSPEEAGYIVVNYRKILKPDGILKILPPSFENANLLSTKLNGLGFSNVEIIGVTSYIAPSLSSRAETEPVDYSQELITDDIVVIDSMFPQAVPMGFRNMEINGLIEEISNFNSYTMYPIKPGAEAWFQHYYGKSEDEFNKNKTGYLKYYPKNDERVKYLYNNKRYEFKLAYSYFLAETYTLLPFFEKYNIPFVFVLYPGGGFGLNNPSSDAMLRRIFNSTCFRKVITTQKVTLEYLAKNNFCSFDKIKYLFGGYIQFQKDEVLQKKFYPVDKATFDICFVAAKYSPMGIDKGYDLFVNTAKVIAKEYPFVRFHVVGGFSENDIDVSEIQGFIKFYGFQSPEFLKEFYSKMDICLSPNRPFMLFPGNFDGFPLGAEAMSCQTALFTTDELQCNDNIFNDEEIVIIKPELSDIVEKVRFYLNNIGLLYEMSKKGQEKLYAIMDPKDRIINVANILKETCIVKEAQFK